MSRITRTSRRAAAHELIETEFYADRVRVYPKAVGGIARDLKWAVLLFCLTVYYTLPWVRWERGPGRPNQALLLDIAHRRFYVFGLELWPQDIYFLAGGLILGAISLFLVTSLAGRIWCGYSCPQTVWTDLFMWVERRFVGDRNARMRRDAGPLTLDLAWRKVAKHAIWLAIAFWTGGAWIMYFSDAPSTVVAFWHGTAPTPVYFFTFLFAATTYLLGGIAREQVCTYMCPWPRFQASMLDEQSLIVTYQSWRGEPRGHHRKDAVGGQKFGDCIDCHACVNACPTGIDIRDGVQLECINCGLCVDACNEIMDRSGGKRWLITWDTLARQKAKAAGRFEPFHLLRPRTVIYVSALCVAVAIMGVALLVRPLQILSVQHDRAPLFVMLKDGGLRNAYTVKIANKTQRDTTFALGIEGLEQPKMMLAEQKADQPALDLRVPADSIATFRVLVVGHPAHMRDGEQDVTFTMRNTLSGERSTEDSVFLGPGAPVR